MLISIIELFLYSFVIFILYYIEYVVIYIVNMKY